MIAQRDSSHILKLFLSVVIVFVFVVFNFNYLLSSNEKQQSDNTQDSNNNGNGGSLYVVLYTFNIVIVSVLGLYMLYIGYYMVLHRGDISDVAINEFYRQDFSSSSARRDPYNLLFVTGKIMLYVFVVIYLGIMLSSPSIQSSQFVFNADIILIIVLGIVICFKFFSFAKNVGTLSSSSAAYPFPTTTTTASSPSSSSPSPPTYHKNNSSNRRYTEETFF